MVLDLRCKGRKTPSCIARSRGFGDRKLWLRIAPEELHGGAELEPFPVGSRVRARREFCCREIQAGSADEKPVSCLIATV